jgi:hypothetical protein
VLDLAKIELHPHQVGSSQANWNGEQMLDGADDDPAVVPWVQYLHVFVVLIHIQELVIPMHIMRLVK